VSTKLLQELATALPGTISAQETGNAQQSTSTEQQYVAGPIWDIQFVRTKPGHQDVYLQSLIKLNEPIWREEKKQGLILDRKVFNNLTKTNLQDWDLAVAVEFKNFAAMDGFQAKEVELAVRLAGSKQAETDTYGEQREAVREVLSSKLLQELLLK
jgi:hypothetical protein